MYNLSIYENESLFIRICNLLVNRFASRGFSLVVGRPDSVNIMLHNQGTSNEKRNQNKQSSSRKTTER